MTVSHHYMIVEAGRELGIDEKYIIHCIRCHWIRPGHAEESQLDEQDLARLRFIHQLQHEFGVNDESVEIILNLVDQLLYLQAETRRKAA